MEWISVNDHFPEQDDTLSRYRETHMQVMTVLAAGYLNEYSEKRQEKAVSEVNRLYLEKCGIEYVDRDIVEGWQWSRRFHKITHWMPLPEPPENTHG